MAKKDDREQREGGKAGGRSREPVRARPRDRGPSTRDIEASETDGKGTGGVGADAGGYGPVPGSESTG